MVQTKIRRMTNERLIVLRSPRRKPATQAHADLRQLWRGIYVQPKRRKMVL